jgi:neutral amino acid transport system ATP-binding protein
VLKVENVSKSFGGIRAVWDCSLDLGHYAVTGLIGPNGSGKTTLFNLITGLINPDGGMISFQGRRIDGSPPHELAQHGLIRTFQLSRVFPRMTVLDNMMLAPRGQSGENLLPLWLKPRQIRREERINRQKAEGFIDLIGLDHLKHQFAENLSYGQQKLLELGRALMADPVMILLDEPTAGINPRLIGTIIDMIQRLKESGKTFFIIEHNMDVIIELCDWVFVLDGGTKIAEGRVEEIQNDSRVIEAYLGV